MLDTSEPTAIFYPQTGPVAAARRVRAIIPQRMRTCCSNRGRAWCRWPITPRSRWCCGLS